MGLCIPQLPNMWPCHLSHGNCWRWENIGAPSHSCREMEYFSTVHLFLDKNQVLTLLTLPLRDCLGLASLICVHFLYIFIPSIFTVSLCFSLCAAFPSISAPLFLHCFLRQWTAKKHTPPFFKLHSCMLLLWLSLCLYSSLWPVALMAKTAPMCLHSCRAK